MEGKGMIMNEVGTLISVCPMQRNVHVQFQSTQFCVKVILGLQKFDHTN